MAPALPSAPIRVETNLRGSATGTNHAVRPAPHSDVVDAVVRIREVDDCFLKARRFLGHLRSPLMKMYQKPVGESSKLLPFSTLSGLGQLIKVLPETMLRLTGFFENDKHHAGL